MGQALETVTIQHESAKAPRIARISARVRRAVDEMVLLGRKREDAAKTAGLTDDALYRALRKPEVLAYLNSQQGVLRTSAAARSIARIDNLADAAESEHVKLQSNVFLLGIEGISPVTKTESVNIHKHLMPGLTIVMGGWAGHQDDPRVIDGQAREAGSPHVINRIGQSSPHPEAGTVAESEPLPEKTQGRRRKTPGGK